MPHILAQICDKIDQMKGDATTGGLAELCPNLTLADAFVEQEEKSQTTTETGEALHDILNNTMDVFVNGNFEMSSSIADQVDVWNTEIQNLLNP